MSAPHADRDHSEQPCCGDYNHEPCRGCPDGRDAGTSRSGAARVVRASEAQVVAALDVLNCGAYQNRRGVVVCIHERHEHYGAWSERGCPVAAAVADAVVAAGDADEVTRLRAEVERLTNERDRAREECGHEKAMRASQREELMQHFGKRREAEAERDRLAEVVARVEALFSGGPDTPCRTAWANGVECVEVPLDELRAALSGPTPAETPQNGPEPALSREQGTSGQSGEGQRGAEKRAPSIGDTCCGKCPGDTCYVDGVTGA